MASEGWTPPHLPRSSTPITPLQNLCPCLTLSFLFRSHVQLRRGARMTNACVWPSTTRLVLRLVSAADGASLCLPDKVEEMTHAQKASPIDTKIATIKPRPSSRCLVTAADMNVSGPSGPFLMVQVPTGTPA